MEGTLYAVSQVYRSGLKKQNLPCTEESKEEKHGGLAIAQGSLVGIQSPDLRPLNDNVGVGVVWEGSLLD